MPRKKKEPDKKEEKLHKASISFYSDVEDEELIVVRLEFEDDVEEDGTEAPVYKLAREMYLLVAEQMPEVMESVFGEESEEEDEEEEDARKTTRAKGNTTIN